MSFKIVRNDITKMNTEAIVNTASNSPIVGSGCDSAVYAAAGYDELLSYRIEKIGNVPEGDAFITPGFALKAKYIIHAVSPLFLGGGEGEEEKLRSCYRKSLQLAKENGIRSISFPLIATGGFGYPKEEGMRIAVDEINAFLLQNDMDIFLVVFDSTATALGERIYPDLEAYIDRHYVEEKREEEYGDAYFGSVRPGDKGFDAYRDEASRLDRRLKKSVRGALSMGLSSVFRDKSEPSASMYEAGTARDAEEPSYPKAGSAENAEEPSYTEAGPADGEELEEAATGPPYAAEKLAEAAEEPFYTEARPADGEELAKAAARPLYAAEKLADDVGEVSFDDVLDASRLDERMKHLSDTFSQYLMFLIKEKGLSNVDVYKRAIVDKKVFSKIKNDPDYHPQKPTVLRLCIGAMLNLDEARDLLARAGYALSPCDKTDVVFSYFVENKIYNMIEIDIKLEEYGLPCIIN